MTRIAPRITSLGQSDSRHSFNSQDSRSKLLEPSRRPRRKKQVLRLLRNHQDDKNRVAIITTTIENWAETRNSIADRASRTSVPLAQAHHPLHPLPQLRRIEPYSSTKYDLRISNVGRRPYRVAGDDDEVRLHTRLNRANPLVEAEDLGAVRRHDLNRLLWREPRLDQQLVVALVAVPRDGSSGSTDPIPAPSNPPRLHERPVEFHRLLEDRAL